MRRRIRRRAEKSEGDRFRLKAGILAGLLVLKPVWGRSAQWKEDKCRHEQRPQCRKFPMQTLRRCDRARPTSDQSGYRDGRWRRASRWKVREARSPFAATSSLSSPRGSPQSDLFSSPPLFPTSTAAVSSSSPPLSQPTVFAFPHPDRLYSPSFSCSHLSSQSVSHSPLASAALSPFSRCSFPTFCSSPVEECTSPPCCSPPSPWTPFSCFFPAASALVHARRWNLGKEENRLSHPASKQRRFIRLRSSLRCLHWPILFLSALLVCTCLSPSLMTSNLPYQKHAPSFFVVIFSHAVSHSHGGISLAYVSADMGDKGVLKTLPQDWEPAESSELRLSPSRRPSPFRHSVTSRSSSSQKSGRSDTSRQRAALPVPSVPFLFSQYGMASRVVSPLRLETQATKPSASSPDSQEKNLGGKSPSEHDFVAAVSPHTEIRPADSRNASSSGGALLSMKDRHRQERQQGRGGSSPPRTASSPKGAAPASEGSFPSFTERRSSLGEVEKSELLKLSADDSAFEKKTLKLRKGIVRPWPVADPSFSGSLSTRVFSPSRKHGPLLHGSSELAEENSTAEEDRSTWIPIASSQGDGESEDGPEPQPEGVEEMPGSSGGSRREGEVTGRGERWSGRPEGANNTGELMHRQKAEKGRLRRRNILRDTMAENEVMAGANMLGEIDGGVEEALWTGAYPGSFLGIRSSDDDGDDGDDDGDEEEEEEEESKHKHHPKHHKHKHDSEEEETEEDEEKEHRTHKASESGHSHRDQRYAHTGASVAHILQGNEDDGMREIEEEKREYDEERMEENRERDEERREDRRERDAERREDKEETDEEISEEQEERGARKGRRSETHASHSASSFSTEEDLSTVLTMMSPAFVPGTGSHANTGHHEESLAEKKHKSNGAGNAAGSATQIPAQAGQAAAAGTPGVAAAAPGTPMMLQKVPGAPNLVAGGIAAAIPAAAFPQATMVAGSNGLPQGVPVAAPAVPTAPSAAAGAPAAAASGAPPGTPSAAAASGAPPGTPPAAAAPGAPPGTPPATAATSGAPPGTPPGTPAEALGAVPGAPVATPGAAPTTATPPAAAGTPGVVAGGPGLVPAVVAPAAGVAPLVAAAPGTVAGVPPTAVVVPTTAEQAAVAAEVAREQLVAATLAAEGLAPGAGVPPPPPHGRGWKAWSLGLLAFAIVVAFSCCGGCGYVFNNKLTRSLRRMRRKYKDALARRRLSEMEKQRAKKHGEKVSEDSGEEKGGEGKNHRHKDSKSSDEKGDGKRQAKAALKLRGNPPAASDKNAEKR
ncbi:putative transmembrane protein [Toxoplasma gondii RUB]|uniref:Putative transmembrane protein n=1 Tax=Toxoplasma gondii RUB TaxID=935652 RepID=A0A086MBS5_TOXGO|nr:putative transmembrane protein [Toxoplasma gondii RUB]